MPCNLFGPNDNYNLVTSHFIPAAISKIHSAKLNNEKKVYFWGDGRPLREVMYVDHLARAIIFFLKKNTKDYLINIGSGYERSIFQFTNIIKKQINCDARIIFNKKNFLNGVPKKILDCSIARKYGFRIRSNFLSELKTTYKSFLGKY
jgi:GDP-L-fucose synthase